jgi:hypothetical protein
MDWLVGTKDTQIRPIWGLELLHVGVVDADDPEHERDGPEQEPGEDGEREADYENDEPDRADLRSTLVELSETPDKKRENCRDNWAFAGA